MLLRGKNFYLRFLRLTDANRCFAAIEESRSELERFMIWVPKMRTVDDERRFIVRMQERRRAGQELAFGIFDASTRHYFGGVGLHAITSLNQSGEIGYWIRTSCAGRGLATAAAAHAVRFGFEQLRLHRMILRAATDNGASLRVAEKLGFQLDGKQRHEMKLARGWIDLHCYSMLESEYRLLKGRLGKLAAGWRL